MERSCCDGVYSSGHQRLVFIEEFHFYCFNKWNTFFFVITGEAFWEMEG